MKTGGHKPNSLLFGTVEMLLARGWSKFNISSNPDGKFGIWIEDFSATGVEDWNTLHILSINPGLNLSLTGSVLEIKGSSPKGA